MQIQRKRDGNLQKYSKANADRHARERAQAAVKPDASAALWGDVAKMLDEPAPELNPDGTFRSLSLGGDGVTLQRDADGLLRFDYGHADTTEVTAEEQPRHDLESPSHSSSASSALWASVAEILEEPAPASATGAKKNSSKVLDLDQGVSLQRDANGLLRFDFG